MKIHLCGGSESFRAFIEKLSLAGIHETTELHFRAKVAELPGDELKQGDLCFLLPDYPAGERFIPELPFEKMEALLAAAGRGCRFYVENYMANDYFHCRFFPFQVMGRERHLHQEYVEFENTILQSRRGFYFPAVVRGENVELAAVSNCIGTTKIFRPGTFRQQVLLRSERFGLIGSVMNFSDFDSRFMRPYSRWKKLFHTLFASLAPEFPAAEIDRAFEENLPETIRISGNSDAEKAVKKAIRWHFDSGLLRSADGAGGMFEMIRSNDLGVRANLRSDVTFLTGAFFVAAGKKYGDGTLSRTGMNLADFLLKRNIQLPDGFIKWFDHTDTVWSSDASRDGLALFNLYKQTGETRYFDAARRLADALLSWLDRGDGLCCGYFVDSSGYEGRTPSDNPVYYGEMASFLLQFRLEKYTRAVLRFIDRIGEKFPDVAPFGFSDNFTYSRYLLMLSCAQYHTGRDFSREITRMLEFFSSLQEKCGGLRETPIRLEDHPEAGVAIGDGSDSIADLLYCNNFVFNALSVLRKLPPERRGSIDSALAGGMYEKLREFLLEIQIRSPFAELDGAWMRSFDMNHREYYGLNKDMDWGPYCVMGGWVMSFLPLVLLFETSDDSFFVN